MVGRHHDDRVVEHSAAGDLAQERTQSTVEISNRVVIEVIRHEHGAKGQLQLIQRIPLMKRQPVVPGRWPYSEPGSRVRWDLVGRVGIVVIQEGEEWPAPPALP